MGGGSSSLVPEAVSVIVCDGVNLAKNVFAIHDLDHIDSDRTSITLTVTGKIQ